MARIIITTVFLYLCYIPLKGFAQADTSLAALPQTWTLQQCIDYAKRNNIEINSLRLNEKTDQQNVQLAKAAKYPNLLGSSSQTFTNSKNANPVVGGFQTQSSFASNYSLNSSVTIYNGGAINNNIKQTETQLKADAFNTSAMENSIILQLTQAYLAILLAKENSIYLQDLLNTSQAQLKQGTIRYNAGSISKLELVGFQSQVATDQYNLITTENNIRQNTLTLKQLLQLPSGYNMQIIQPDTVATAPKLVDALDLAQQQAHDSRPEIKSSALGVDMARYSLEKAKAGKRPTITGSGGLSTGYSDNQSSAYIRQLDNNFYQRIGIGLSIPIFNNRIARTNIENAKIAIDAAKLNLKKTETTLSQEVEQAYINVLNAQAQYEAAVTQLNTNRETYQISGEQLRLGAITSVDFLLQKNLYIQALQQYIQAKYNAIIGVKVYDFYKGTPVTIE
ncbi:MAG: TolC family protein [Niabella sp.]|nr:TolC family protein [Niabella sp.]